MTAVELAAFSPEWVAPISVDYRGWRVYELPPQRTGRGRAQDAEDYGDAAPSVAGTFSPADMHLRIEAMKLAYSDVHRYVADPKTYDCADCRAALP